MHVFLVGMWSHYFLGNTPRNKIPRLCGRLLFGWFLELVCFTHHPEYMSSPVCPHSHSHLGLPFLLILAILWDVKCSSASRAHWGRGSLFSCVYLWSLVILIGCGCGRMQWALRNHFPQRETSVLEEIKYFCSDLSPSAIPPTLPLCFVQ